MNIFILLVLFFIISNNVFYATGSWEVLGSSSMYKLGETIEVNGFSCVELKRFRTFDVPSEVLAGAQSASIKLFSDIPEIRNRVKNRIYLGYVYYYAYLYVIEHQNADFLQPLKLLILCVYYSMNW